MKSRRHTVIRTLIDSGEIYSQGDLAKQLARNGIEATQATLSRDLAELGVLKGPAGYQLPSATPAVTTPELGLTRALKRELVSVLAAHSSCSRRPLATATRSRLN